MPGAVWRNGRAECRGDGPGRGRASNSFPLTCDYRERPAAAGKFPGGFLKREGRPTMKETLTSRLIDRPIRPLFPDGFNDEVQIQSFVLASDRQNDGDVLAMNGASAALGISPLPFQGPLGSVRLGRIDGKFVPFPTHDELEDERSRPDRLRQRDAVLMIEGFAREMPEDRMLEAISEAHRYRPRALRPAAGADRQGRRRRRRTSCRRRTTACYDRLKSRYYDELKAAKQTERQAGPGRSGVSSSRRRPSPS